MLQEFVEQVEKAARSVMEEMHTAIPGKITAFNAGTGFATVKPYGTYTTDSGRKMAYPTVTEVPVIIPQSQVNDMIKIPDIQKFALTKNIDILYEEDAVIMGKTLNRVVCGEDGKVQKIFAGNIAAVKHEKDIIKDINKEDIEFVEKSLRPIERIFGGEVFFKS